MAVTNHPSITNRLDPVSLRLIARMLGPKNAASFQRSSKRLANVVRGVPQEVYNRQRVGYEKVFREAFAAARKLALIILRGNLRVSVPANQPRFHGSCLVLNPVKPVTDVTAWFNFGKLANVQLRHEDVTIVVSLAHEYKRSEVSKLWFGISLRLPALNFVHVYAYMQNGHVVLGRMGQIPAISPPGRRMAFANELHKFQESLVRELNPTNFQ